MWLELIATTRETVHIRVDCLESIRESQTQTPQGLRAVMLLTTTSADTITVYGTMADIAEAIAKALRRSADLN